MVAQVRRKDEIDIAWNESKKGPPFVITEVAHETENLNEAGKVKALEEGLLAAKIFRDDGMGVAGDDSEKERFCENCDRYLSPVVITAMEHVPWVHMPPPIPPGIRDDVLKSIPSDTNSVYEPSQSKSCLEKERSARIEYDQRPLTAVTVWDIAPPSNAEYFTKQSAGRSVYTTLDLYVGFWTLAKESRDLTMQWLATILVSNFRHILDFKIMIR